MNDKNDYDIFCEFCKTKTAVLSGWFYAVARDNEFAKGTASYNLLQKRVVCQSCAENAIKSGMTPASKIEGADEL